MLRNGLAALAGVIGAVVLTMVLQFVAHIAAPPSSELIEAFQKITSDDPASIDPTGAPRPFERQNITESTLAAISRTGVPRNSAALKTRAPSM